MVNISNSSKDARDILNDIVQDICISILKLMCAGVRGGKHEDGRRGLVGAAGSPTGRRSPLRCRGWTHRLRIPGPQEAVAQRNLQPAEAGAAGSQARAGLHDEASQRGAAHLDSVNIRDVNQLIMDDLDVLTQEKLSNTNIYISRFNNHILTPVQNIWIILLYL